MLKHRFHPEVNLIVLNCLPPCVPFYTPSHILLMYSTLPNVSVLQWTYCSQLCTYCNFNKYVRSVLQCINLLHDARTYNTVGKYVHAWLYAVILICHPLTAFPGSTLIMRWWAVAFLKKSTPAWKGVVLTQLHLSTLEEVGVLTCWIRNLESCIMGRLISCCSVS